MVNNPLPVPLTRNNISNPLPPNYLITNDGRPFLAWDSGDASRILFFITPEKLTLLEQSQHWFIDGTFDTVPLIYSQLFTIHALTMGTVIVCGFALLPNKTQPTYLRLFQELHNMNQNLNPSTVLIDFEVAVKNALEIVFPGVDVKGCYFHLTQNIYKRIKDNGLQVRYQQDAAFTLEVRMIAALAFVPGNDVNQYFNTLSGQIDQSLQIILDYFEDNYIGVVRRGNFRPPWFPYAMWDVHDRVQNDLLRTNNAVEGWHNSFNTNIGGHHVNFWKFLTVIKKEEDLSRVKCVHLQQGRAPANPHRVYAAVNATIGNVVANYANRQPMDYLRGIAMNIDV